MFLFGQYSTGIEISVEPRPLLQTPPRSLFENISIGALISVILGQRRGEEEEEEEGGGGGGGGGGGWVCFSIPATVKLCAMLSHFRSHFIAAAAAAAAADVVVVV